MADLDGLASDLESVKEIRERVKRYKMYIADASDPNGKTDLRPISAKQRNLCFNFDELSPVLRRMRAHAKRTAPSIPDISAFLGELLGEFSIKPDELLMHSMAWDLKRMLQGVRSRWRRMRSRPPKNPKLRELCLLLGPPPDSGHAFLFRRAAPTLKAMHKL